MQMLGASSSIYLEGDHEDDSDDPFEDLRA